MRVWFVAPGLVGLAALLLWLTLRAGDADAPAPRAATGAAAAADVPSTPVTGAEGSGSASGGARAAVPPPPPPAFTCVDDDGNVVPDAVRDGVVIRVLGPDRLALAGTPLDVRWRKGWGEYGNDRGVTDARGELATTVSHHEMLEAVTLQHPTLGALERFSGFLPAFAEPRMVVCVVPALEPLVVRLLDERGRPVAGGTIECDVDREPVALREHPLLHDPGELVTDRDGRVRLSVRAGEVVLRAKAERHVSLYQLTATVPVGGCTLTAHVLSADALHPVRVTLDTPHWISRLRVRAIGRELPPLPDLASSGVEPLQQDYPVRWPARRAPVVDAPPTTWSCHVSADQCEPASVVVAPSTTDVPVTLRRRAATPVARLRCRLLDPDGVEVHGEVMVHTEPNLVRGSRHQVSTRDPWVEVPPGGTAVVSGWRYRSPPAFAGPLVLTAGEHEVVLQFARPKVIRGRVVDERGEPVKASVALYRPAGLLQRLGTNVPPILDGVANGDSHTTGDDGVFRFEHVGDGEHALSARPKGNGWPTRRTVAAGDENVVLRLGENCGHLARVQGRVTRAGTGEGVASRVGWRAGDGVHERFTDADGRYTIALPPGTWRPEVKAPRHAYLLGEPTELAAGVTTTFDLVVTPSEPLFVVVRDAAGRVPDVAIEAFDARGLPIVLLDAFANDDGDARPGRNGRAVLRGLPDGELRLRLTDANDALAIQDVVVPAGTRRDVELAIPWVPQRRPLPAEAK